MGAPFRIRDHTFPNFLILGFTPAPSAPLGRGNFAVEMHSSVINNFQVSPEVENYLEQSRGGSRRSLDTTDVAFILGLPQGQAYYIDGEFSMLEFAFHWGITNQLDLGMGINYMHYGGQLLDETIMAFHDSLGLGQGGREYVDNNQVQVVMGRDNAQDIVLLDRPSSGGFGDPNIFVRYALPQLLQNWRSNLEIGIKIPLMSEQKYLSTGSWDFGYQLTIDRLFERDAWIINAGEVFPGEYKQSEFQPPNLPFINISWMHRFKDWNNTRFFTQVLVAKHPYRELVASGLSDIASQITLGFKWNTKIGIIGFGVTENLFNFDNTPDVGLHLTWGILK